MDSIYIPGFAFALESAFILGLDSTFAFILASALATSL